jgi:serine/threonine protein phosphatase PrpC
LCASVTPTPQTFYLPLTDPFVVAVADGLGGHPAGEDASALVARRLARTPPAAEEDSVRAVLAECNELIYAEAALTPQRARMGTTVAGLVFDESGAIVFNVGDSRVYSFEGDELCKLTTDDNDKPLPWQRRSNVVTQTLGGSVTEDSIEPHVLHRQVELGQRYLVCSDGLTDAVEETDIAALLREHRAGRAAFELWRAAITGGGPDNITLALAEIETG